MKKLFKISALTHEGTQELIQQITRYLNEKKRLQAEADAIAKAQTQPEITAIVQTDMSVFKAE